MPKLEQNPIYICDLCGKDFGLGEMSVSDFQPIKIQSLTCDIWYNGIFTAKYICIRCNNKLQEFISDLNPNKKFTTNGWEKKK